MRVTDTLWERAQFDRESSNVCYLPAPVFENLKINSVKRPGYITQLIKGGNDYSTWRFLST